MTGRWQTTDEEDAAVLALTGETSDVFLTRHLRHQIEFALSNTRAKDSASLTEQIRTATPEQRDQIAAILKGRT